MKPSSIRRMTNSREKQSFREEIRTLNSLLSYLRGNRLVFAQKMANMQKGIRRLDYALGRMRKNHFDQSHSYVSVKIGERKILLNKSALVRRKRVSWSRANRAYARRRIDRLIKNLRDLDSNLNLVLRHVDSETRSRLLKMMRSVRQEHLGNWGLAGGNLSKNKELKRSKPAKKRKVKNSAVINKGTLKIKAKPQKLKKLSSKDKTTQSGTKQAARTDQPNRLKKKVKAQKSKINKWKKSIRKPGTIRPNASSPQIVQKSRKKNAIPRRQRQVNPEFFESTTRDFPEQRVDDLLQDEQNQDSLFQDPRYIDTITA